MYRHTIACRTYKAGQHCARQVPSFLTPAFKDHLLFIHFSLQRTTFHSTMVGESDQISNVVSDAADSSSQSGTAAESKDASSTSSSTMANQTIANKAVPLLYEYWKAPTVTDKEITTYHDIS
jgi:hypothetical protein